MWRIDKIDTVKKTEIHGKKASRVYQKALNRRTKLMQKDKDNGVCRFTYRISLVEK